MHKYGYLCLHKIPVFGPVLSKSNSLLINIYNQITSIGLTLTRQSRRLCELWQS